MASSGNFCTWNPNDCVSSLKFNTGNLSTDQDNNDWRGMFGTHPFTSGKWYWEAYQNSNNSNNGFPVAIQRASDGLNYLLWSGSNAYLGRTVGTYGYSYAIYTNAPTYSEKRHNNSSTNTNLSAGTTGDIYQLAVDLDAGKIWFGKNNTWADSGDPANGSNEAFSSIPAGTYVPASTTWNSSGSDNFVSNWGQDDTFGGAITAAGNADGNGHGVFKYSPPTGFLALCSANLPISDDIDPAQTDDDIPQKQFGVVTYTGDNSTSNAITGLGFQPDLVWIKARDDNNAYSNALFDTSRGRAKSIFSDSTRVQNTSSSTQDLVSFDSDGFTVGTSYNTASNLDGKTHVGWCWKVNGGTTASNSEGTITNTLQANTKAGFSISSFTCPSSGAGTLGHGLEKAPDFFIFKPLGAGTYWRVWHKDFATPLRSVMYLQLNAGENQGASDTQQWNNTLPSSTLISLGGGQAGEGASMLYAWHGIEGYSRFGVYTPNTDNNGPFVYTGFRPRMIWIKMLVSGDGWGVWDTARSTFNVMDDFLRWDSNNAETTGTAYHIDFLSNGFKVRTNNAQLNHSSYGPYIYGAWGDVPFKYNNTF